MSLITKSFKFNILQKYPYLIVLLVLFHACQQITFAQNPNPNPNTVLDSEILDEMSTQHFPGVSSIIVKNGKIVWVESYGYADIVNSISVEDNTVFLLASVSKLFTGTAALQVYEKGIIDIDRDVNNYLPWLVKVPNFTNDSITARQLMTHTSSIDDKWGVMSTFYDYPDPTIPLSSCMENYFTTSGSYYSATDNFLNQTPGSTYKYSNMGSALNGYLVEASSGIPFDDYCDENLFEQLCMEFEPFH